MARKQSDTASYKIAASIAATALLVAIGIISSFRSFRQITEAGEVRKASLAVLKRANEFLSALNEAETSFRGFLITDDDRFLEPYLAVRDDFGKRLEELHRLARSNDSRGYLDKLDPLIAIKLSYLARTIDLRRTGALTSVIAEVRGDEGKVLMDSIRAGMHGFINIEDELLIRYEADFQAKMRRLSMMISATSLFTLLFAFLLYKETKLRLKNSIYHETKELLEIQEGTNRKLREANATLQESEEKLSVTFNSIGDAVLTTDASGRVTGLNPIAEQLTGWQYAEARGRSVDEIFRIINQETRQPAAIPIMETLAKGTTQGLANHTVLISRDGSECAIADSCAPIRNRDGEVSGAVLVFRNVSKEYAAQQALRDSTALVHTILNTVVDSIITIQARGGIIETANPAAERMFGYTAAELVGRNFSLLVPELDQDRRNGSLEYYSASAEARASGLGREVVGKRKDGSLFPLEIAVSEMILGGQRFFTGILRDITTRKNAEEALLDEGALQRAIFNSANFSSIATDAKGVIQIFNVGAERMLGYKAAEVMNKITPADISDSREVIARAEALSLELSTPISPGFEALVFKASRGIEDIYELTYIRKDGSRFPAVVSVTALRDAQNAIIGYLLIGTDNTVRKHIEAERALLNQALLDKNEELQIAKVVAEKANLAKSDFLSSMSHELRTPLSAILGFSQLMESGEPPPTPSQKRSIDQILKAGWYLLELINEILDLALIESGKMSLSMEPVALAELLSECRSMIEPQAQKRDINVVFTPLDIPGFVLADRMRLKQILINLLSNAIKYNREGGSVTVDCIPDPPDSIRISVRDTGEGLAPEQLAQLFEPFNRLGREAIMEEGTGIGLVVCKRLIELMGGVIRAESVVGQGSVFWIEMDLMDETDRIAPSTLTDSEMKRAVPGDASKRTILYVEDNPANLMLVEDLIARRPDLRLLSARDGQHGIDVARSALPDVILMDINLPGISGMDALKILAADPATKRIPVVAVSANAIPRDIERGLKAGFFRYLTKPIRVNEFMDTLDQALKFAKDKA